MPTRAYAVTTAGGTQSGQEPAVPAWAGQWWTDLTWLAVLSRSNPEVEPIPNNRLCAESSGFLGLHGPQPDSGCFGIPRAGGTSKFALTVGEL